MIIIDLVYNLALLVAMSVVSGFVGRRCQDARRASIFQGLVFGSAAVVGMLRPLVLGPGLIFDGRSVMISLCALCFGPRSAAISGGMALVCRILQGGVGARMGVPVIVVSALLGLVFHRRLVRHGTELSGWQLLGFGLLVNGAMLLLAFALPANMVFDVLKKVAVPVLLTYPLATVLIGSVLSDQQHRSRAVEALRASEERLRLAMTAAEQGLFDLNILTGEAIVSPAYARLLGYEPDEFTLNLAKWREALHPDDRDRAYGVYEDYIAGRRPDYRVEFRQKTKTGDWKWILSLGKIVERDPDGRPRRMLGTHTDITALKQMEEALLREEMFTKALVDSLPGIFYLYSYPELRLIRWNRNHETLLGFDAGEMKDRSLMAWHPPEAAEAVRQAVEGVMQRGENMIETSLLTKSGSLVPFILTGVRFDVPGQSYLMGVGVDVSERKRAEADKALLERQYLQAQKMEAVGRLAGGVAHDLNNLLSPILGYGEMLLQQLAAPDASRESVEQIVRAGERARDLVRQLLAFSRKQVLEFKSFDLNNAVTAFEKLLRRTIREDIVIEVSPDASVPPIRGDVGQLEQVIMNLAVNAMDAMPGGGRLAIETAVTELDEAYAAAHQGVAPGRYVLLAISDTGHGMDAQTQARLFEPFFTTKPAGEGTGLGLATSYGIIRQHGGTIGVYSEPGKGTTFKVYLPVSEMVAGDATVAAAVDTRDLRGSETVLLVEDDEGVRAVTGVMLKHYGYTVLLAQDGKEAMSVLAKHDGTVHLLLTDVVMPSMNGRQLFAEACREHPALKVLFMSGYTANVIAHGGVLDQGVKFIHKPFTMHALAAKLREVLDARP